VYEYGLQAADDPKAACIPLIEYASASAGPSYSAYLFYNGDDATPPSLGPFLSLPQITSTYSYRSMHEYALETNEVALLTGFRQRFWVLPISLDRAALQIIHDAYLDACKQFGAGLGIYITALAVMPVPKTFFTASQVNGGDPQSVDPDQAPYVWVEESFSYTGTLTDEQVDVFYEQTNGAITSQLAANGINLAAFHYLNDANKLQTDAVWAGFPPASIQRLKEIRAKYDPDGVFTRLMPGGWKVEDAR
jgi:hypothetical protein